MIRNFTSVALLLILLAACAKSDSAMTAYRSGDFATALREFRPRADQGDAQAQYILGVMYTEGDGVPRDYSQAASWFKMAAEHGDSEAQFNLGFMYANGRGVPEDDAEAVRWYRLAAE